MTNERSLIGINSDGPNARLERSFVSWTWGGKTRSTTYTYDEDGRLKTVAAFGRTTTYAYDSVNGMLDTLSYDGSNLQGKWDWDEQNRLRSLSWTKGLEVITRHSYTFDAMNRRKQALRENGEPWHYDYNLRGELRSGVKAKSTAENADLKPGLQFAYDYDLIGNRVLETVNTPGGNQSMIWQANAANQVTQRPIAGSRWVLGRAHPEALLSTQGTGTPVRDGWEFALPVEAQTANAAEWRELSATASRPGAGENGADLAGTQQGNLWFAASPESLVYDEDGNLSADGRWAYDWNAENRLISMQTIPAALAAGVPARRLEFAYDAQGRRIRKLVQSFVNPEGPFTLIADKRYLYDGWNVVAEFTETPSTSLGMSQAYAWGNDLSGSMQGAGGIGGLVLAQDVGTGWTYAPCYDGNGNVSAYVSAISGIVRAKFDYDPFGRRVWNELASPIEQLPPFRFSTKQEDDESGLLYYGYRYYSPGMGRWISRDPIEEDGGINLYGMVRNDPVNYFDADGRFPGSEGHGDKISPADSAALINSEQNKADATFDSSLPNARNPRQASLGRNLYRLNSIRKAIGTDAENKFVFTCKYGWIDHGHFYNNAYFTYMTGGRALPAIGSWLNEAGQWLLGSDSSWTLEDLESNALGRQLGQDALDHDRPVINSWQNQPLGMGTAFARTLNQRRPYIPVSGGQFYHIAAAWKRLLREGGAVHWPDDRDIRGLVNSILDEDIRHYLSNPINITSVEQARAFRQTSKAWQCLCNGDKPSMNVLIYR